MRLNIYLEIKVAIAAPTIPYIGINIKFDMISKAAKIKRIYDKNR